MKLVLLSLVLLANVSFAANEGPVDCQSSPGSLICRNLADIKHAFSYTCTGDACYRVWRNQVNALNRFTQNYDAYVTYSPVASAELGQLAYDASRKLCGSKATGACSWMKSIFHAKAAAKQRLVELQRGAGLHSIMDCSVSYHCP